MPKTPPSRAGSAQIAVNEVRLVGRLARTVEERTLPSGDLLTVFSIVVDRLPVRGSVRVDSIACVTTRRAVATSVLRWRPGDWVAAEGAIRRRFWRSGPGSGSGSGLGSATEVEVTRISRVRAE